MQLDWLEQLEGMVQVGQGVTLDHLDHEEMMEMTEGRELPGPLVHVVQAALAVTLVPPDRVEKQELQVNLDAECYEQHFSFFLSQDHLAQGDLAVIVVEMVTLELLDPQVPLVETVTLVEMEELALQVV